MSKHFNRFGFAAIASFLFLLSAALPTGPMAGNSQVVVDGYAVNGNQIAVTLTNHGPSHKHGELILVVSLDDGSTEQVVVGFSINGGSTATYTTTTSSDITGAVEQGIIDSGDPT